MTLSSRIATLLPFTRLVTTSTSIAETRVITPVELLIPTRTVLRAHTGFEFTQLRSVTAIDHPKRTRRFEVVYLLLSPSTGQRLAVSVNISEGTPVPSMTQLFSSAG